MSSTLFPEPASQKNYTANDLLTMPDGDHFELVNGKIVEQNKGAQATFLAGAIYLALRSHAHSLNLGWVFPAGACYQCFINRENTRRPDVSFIRQGRLPNERIPVGHIKIAPDLAVEVVSPFDSALAIDEKVEEYRDIEVPLIWVVHPQLKLVKVYRQAGDDTVLWGTDSIDGENIVPGFKLSLDGLFKSVQKPTRVEA